ncbi:MAG: DNA polymerase III subunit alpha [Anaerolineae bacterium]|jgi:DNA-directed DNA polymerase III PolC|nr:DNA polymerase III subunit alpha [Anaerolineae bacterium]
MAGIAHLHVHSHLSLLGGTASPEELVARAAADGLPALALTDTNALYGAVSFDRACRAAGIRPLLGMTVTVAPPAAHVGPVSWPGRLVLLATGPQGYRSLCRLSSLVQAQPERETLAARGLAWEDLAAHSQGVLCLGGGRAGWIERLWRAGQAEQAAGVAARLAEIYDGAAYLSLEIHGPGDEAVALELAALALRHGLRPVAAQPVYCLEAADASRLRLLAAIDHNVPLAEVPPHALPAAGDPAVDLHWLPPAEVAARFARLPEALAAVEEVVALCEPVLPDGRPVWPDLKLPPGRSPDEALALLAGEGLDARYGPGASPRAHERLVGELAAIARHGYAPLFLVVADITRFAREAGIPFNTRGSVANSLVAYCAGITNVDPIAHDLLFERFLNPARAEAAGGTAHGLPDIDLDFCSRRRDEVLDYVRRTYGADRVALVSTISTLQPRGAVREVAKAYGLDEAQASRLVSMLPRHWHPDPRRRDRRTVEDVLAELPDARHRQVVTMAYELVGQPHHLSVHPGGLVITPGPLTDLLPLQWAPKGFYITQYDHLDVEAVGLPKLDLLGIRALTVLADAERLVRRHGDPAFQLASIPEDDPAAAALLSRAETIGVFQCESVGARRTLRQLRARTVRDLAVANAFFKPGPAMGGMAAAFVRRYRGQEAVSYLDPALEPILANTMGVLLFQEQVLRVAREVAGLSWAQADRLRHGMGHFGHGEMAALEAQFVSGCRRPPPEGPGMSRQQAETLWQQVLAFAGYGFNQGHATSYALVSYRSAYLKAHWPAAFFCARLAEWGGFHHPAIYMAEARRLGIAVRPPHVNHSGSRFRLEIEGDRPVLWMGLGQVRDVRRESVRAIVAGRRERPFASLRDLLARLLLQPKEVQHLVQCGALDGLPAADLESGESPSRAALLEEAAEIQRAGSALQMTFGFARPPIPAETPVQRLAWEQRLLGHPLSVHPLEVVAARLPDYLSLARLPETGGRPVAVAGVRLPGWPGGPGFFLGDAETFILARGERGAENPPPWQPLWLRGRWQCDEWETCWFQIEELRRVGQ